MIITTVAYPRAALIGNPSDGYHGKTIAFVFSNYRARVQLYETPDLEILPSRRRAAPVFLIFSKYSRAAARKQAFPGRRYGASGRRERVRGL